MSLLTTNKIGTIYDDQITIEENIDLDYLNKIVFGNKEYLSSIIKKNKNKFFLFLNDSISKLNFPFPITRQIYLFIKNNEKDLNLIFNYLAFRLKFYLSSTKLIDLDHPPYLLIETVSTCNLRCQFCFQTDKTFTKKPYMGVMDYSLFKKIEDEADRIGTGAITLGSRGEPSLHKNISDLVNYLGTKKNIFEKKFITNATKLNSKLINSLLTNNFNIIQISADHYKKAEYEKLRLNSNFEEIVKNVDNLYNIRKKNYPHSISEIRVSGVDANKNLDRKKFEEFWKIRSDHVTAGFPHERWNTYLNQKHPTLNTPCQDLWDRMYVWFDGKCNPCDADYKSYLSYGNINENSIKKYGILKKLRSLRLKHLNNQRKNIVPCDRCGIDFKN